jgi:recombination protein RecT
MSENTSIAARDPRVDKIRAAFQAAGPKLAASIPATMKKHMTPDRIANIVVSAALRQPALLECSPASILKSCMTATALGLECDGLLGGAYLVPFWNSKTRQKEAQFIVGYRGLIDLARRSGNITSIEAHVVHSNDKFRCQFGLEPKLEHEPDWNAETPGPMVAVYAIARFRDGGYQFEVMTRAQVDAVRQMSKAGDFGPWKDHYLEMARKTVVRRLSKYLPLSIEVREAMVKEDAQEPAAPTAVAEMSALMETTIDAESTVSEPQTETLSTEHGGGEATDFSDLLDPRSE